MNSKVQMATVSISSSKHAWNLLRGVACLYKPSGISCRTVMEEMKEKLAVDLNQLKRQHEIRPPNYMVDDYTNSIDYSLHPLVLGDGFEKDDIRLKTTRLLQHRMSGLFLVHVNDSFSVALLRSQRFPATYHVDVILGYSTDSCFYDGKVLQKSTYNHLCGRPQILEKLMASIRASFQRESFKQSSFSLQSQEAYDLAAKGPIKPTVDGDPLVYNLRCLKYSPPEVTLEMTSINENYDFMVEFVAEIGKRLKTDAVCSKIRCVRDGIFSVNDALLLKHTNLQNVLNNLAQNEKRLKDYSIQFKRRRGNFSISSQL